MGVQFIFDPVGTVVPLVLEAGTEKVLKAVGVDDQTAAMIGNLTGVVSGGAIGYGQMARAARQGSVRALRRAERAARAEYDRERLAVAAAESEARQGLRHGTAERRVGREGGSMGESLWLD